MENLQKSEKVSEAKGVVSVLCSIDLKSIQISQKAYVTQIRNSKGGRVTVSRIAKRPQLKFEIRREILNKKTKRRRNVSETILIFIQKAWHPVKYCFNL